MKRRHRIIGLCAAALALFLALGILPKLRLSDGSRYIRNVEEDLFSLRMERLNCAIAESFLLREGDAIDVRIDQACGELALSIGREGQEPIYEGRNPELSAFRVTVPEAGEYLLCVSGKRAAGSVSFQILRAESI